MIRLCSTLLLSLTASSFLLSGQPLPASQTASLNPLVVPAGTVLQIRLRQPVSSYTSRRDTPVSAIVIAPVEVNGQVLLPLNTELRGHIRDVRRVGLGFARETALLDLEFNRFVVPGSEERELTGAIAKVDDARERVDEQGRIRGIRATDSFSTMLSGFAISATSFDPMALMFGLSSTLGVFRFPDSSIIFPAGTELRFKVLTDVPVSGDVPPKNAGMPQNPQRESDLSSLIRDLPFRTTTETKGEPSDITTLLFIGNEAAVERAFLAAGWVRSDELNVSSSYGTMRSIVENQGYREAPMSTLLLDNKKPRFTFAKTLNTFFSRHHLRVFLMDATYQGKPVWSSSATHDSGIGFSKQAKTFIHLIDENIDEERSKVVNDLTLTGCTSGATYLNRPWVPLDAKNSTGDFLRTDGKIAVVDLNECQAPSRADQPVAGVPNTNLRQSAFLRPLRAGFLVLRNDLTRGNIAYQAYSGTKMAMGALRKKKVTYDAFKSIRLGGEEFAVVEGAKPIKHQDHPDDPGHRLQGHMEKIKPRTYFTQVMASINSGLTGYGNSRFSNQPVTFIGKDSNGSELFRSLLRLETSLNRGWTFAPRVTLNNWKYLSNEFAYNGTTTHFQVAEPTSQPPFDERGKVRVRQFTYNTLLHLRPNGSRVRPYLAVGPALQLIHLLDSKPHSNSLLNFALRDVALFTTAYNFGSSPPLEGGGVFQVGLNYGAGVQVHVTPRLFMRVDFRETLSKQPDFWTKSHGELTQVSTDLIQITPQPLEKFGPLRFQIVTMGIGIAF